MQTFIFVLILLIAVIASQPIKQALRIVPLPIVQILIGVALAWPVTGGVHVELEPEVFLLVFIPPLLFGDAWQAPKREFKELGAWILSMAFGLVFFTILAFGLTLNWMLPEMPLAVAFAVAAMLSPTDAVAVSSIVDKDKLPPRLLHLLEGEALLNDASGLVSFRFAVAAALTGSFSLVDAAGAFVFAVIGGAAVGAACLYLFTQILKILGKLTTGAAETQVLAMVLLPFVAYLLAEEIGASGVLAAVVAGMLVGRSGLFRYLAVSARMLSSNVWQIISFALNGAIFVMLGLQLPAIGASTPPELKTWNPVLQPALTVLALTLCLMFLRYTFMFVGDLVSRIIDPKRHKTHTFGHRLKLLATLGGVRGAVTLAGIMSLPLLMQDGSPFPERDLAIFLASGVILCWLLAATIFLPRLTAGLASNAHEAAALGERGARIGIAQAAVDKLKGLSEPTTDSNVVSARQAAAQALISAYERRIAALQEGATPSDETAAARKAEVDLRNQAINAEMAALRQMLLAGEINDHTVQKLARELTLSQATLSARSKN